MAGEKEHKNDEMMALMFAIVVVAGVVGMWYAFRYPILLVIFGLDWIQLSLLSLWPPDAETVKHLNFIQAVLTFKIDPNSVTWAEVTAISQHLGYYNYMIMAGLCGFFGLMAQQNMKGDGLRRVFSLTGEKKIDIYSLGGWEFQKGDKGFFKFLTYGYKSKKWYHILIRTITGLFLIQSAIKQKKEWRQVNNSFLRYQSQYWKTILPAVEFNPNTDDERTAQAMTPVEWLRKHGLKYNKETPLDTEKVMDLFGAQLGSQWAGIENAEVHIQAIAVLCFLNTTRQVDKQNDAVGRLNEIWTQDIHNYKKAEEDTREFVKSYMKNPKLVASFNKLTRGCYFTNTAMMKMITIARKEGGVFPSSSMRWLKEYDRPLWYGINNLGRSKYHIEGAGIISHFNAERILNDKISEPYVENALDGVLTYLDALAIEDIDTYGIKEVYYEF